MSATPEPPRFWSNTQAYTLSVIGLLLGLLIGYLLHATAPATAVATQQAPRPPAAGMGQVTPDQLKHMAEKQVEPLLAQLQKNPKDADLLVTIAGSYYAAQQFQNAQEYYERAVAIKPDPPVFSRLSSCYYYLGDVDKAIAALNRALKVAPNDANTLFNLGMLEWRGKTDPKAAIAAWEKLLKAHPDVSNRAQVEQLIVRAKQHLSIPPGTKTDKPAL